MYSAGERAENSSCTEDTEKSPMDDSPLEFLLNTCPPVPSSLCEPDYSTCRYDFNHIIIIMAIQVNRMTIDCQRGIQGSMLEEEMLEIWTGLIHRTSSCSVRRLPQNYRARDTLTLAYFNQLATV